MEHGCPIAEGSRRSANRAAALGGQRRFEGARLYVSTWDYDGGYRPLAPQPGAYTFGGGDPARAPRVSDASAVITLHASED